MRWQLRGDGPPINDDGIRTGRRSPIARHGIMQRNRRLITPLTALVVFAVGLIVMRRFTNIAWTSYSGDSFTVQYDSLRLVQGQVPYRDFFSFLGPGTLCLQALVYWLFGAHAVVATHLLIVALAFTGAGLFLLSHALTGQGLLSWFAPLFLFVGLAPHQPTPYHQWYGIGPTVLTILFMSRWLHSGRRRWLAAAGGACTLTGLFVQTQGLSLAAALVAFLALQAALKGTGPREAVRVFAPNVVALVVGAATVALPVTLALLLMGALPRYVYDTLIWPPLHYGCRTNVSCVNNVFFLADIDAYLFWGSSHAAAGFDEVPILANPARFYGGCLVALGLIVVPLVVAAFAFCLVIGRLREIVGHWWHRLSTDRRPDTSATADLLLLCSIVCLAYLGVFWVGENLSLIHYLYVTIIAYPTLVGFLAIADGPGAKTHRQWFAIALLAPLILGAGVWYASISAPGTEVTIDAIGGSGEIATYVRTHTDTHDTIVVVPTGGTLYFYTRPAAIGYTYVLPTEFPHLVFPPGGFYTATQYREIADQIEARKPRLIIFLPGDDDNQNRYWRSLPPDLLQFVEKNYGDEGGQLGVPQRVMTGEGAYIVYISAR